MLERLQKIISAAGITSRRAAEELIAEGRVRVNGKVVTELGTKADPSQDHIKVDGKLINPKQPQTYLMLNKPAGIVTTMSDPEGRPTVQDLLKGVKVRVYPVGRLDYNTEGLLLLTNDGDFAHLITHPKHEFPKTYLAKVKGVLEDSQIDNLEKGIYLDDGKTAPAKIKKIRKEEANSWLEITIHEGRKRQVRRMFDRVGHSVIRLKRVRTGNLTLGDLPEGTFRYLTPQEIDGLKGLAIKEKKPEVRDLKPDVRKKEGPAPGIIQGQRITGKEVRPAMRPPINRSNQRPRIGRAGVPLMQDTSGGRRKNQVVRPGVKSDYAERKGPGAAAGFGARGNSRYRTATRPVTDRSTKRTGPGKTASGKTTGNPHAGRKPDQRPWPATRSGYSRRAGAGRPSTGTATGKPETRRKPAPRSWSSAGNDSKSKAPRRGTTGDGYRPSSGPRPNRSKFTGSKRLGRGPKPGFRGKGRK